MASIKKISTLFLFLMLFSISCKKKIDSTPCTDCANKLITKFTVQKSDNTGLPEDINFTIDNAKGEITGSVLKWINSASPADLIVSFETNGEKISVNGITQTTHVTKNNFKDPVSYTVTAKDGTEKKYTIKIICPQINASIPVLKIDADAPINSKEIYVTANLEMFGNGISEGVWSSNTSGKKIEIRLRGNSTAWLSKSPFRIKFPDKFSPLGLNHAKEKSWVLLANDADKTLIRNAVAFQVSHIMDDNAAVPRFTPATLFVDVYVDGMYEGNYMLTDQIEVAPGRINVETLKASDGANAAKITGGYFVEIDGFAANEPVYFTSPKGLSVTLKYPKDDDYAPAQFDYINDYFGNKAEAALFATNFTDATNGWRKYFDSNTWIDYYIISEITGNSDAWWSTNVYKHRNDPLLYFGPVWDFDIAFNNDNRITNATQKLMATDAHNPRQWIQRFMEDPSFKAAVKARWNAKKASFNTLAGYIDALVTKIDLSQQANFIRWNITTQELGHAGAPPANYAAGITQLKTYLTARYNYLDGVFTSW